MTRAESVKQQSADLIEALEAARAQIAERLAEDVSIPPLADTSAAEAAADPAESTPAPRLAPVEPAEDEEASEEAPAEESEPEAAEEAAPDGVHARAGSRRARRFQAPTSRPPARRRPERACSPRRWRWPAAAATRSRAALRTSSGSPIPTRCSTASSARAPRPLRLRLLETSLGRSVARSLTATSGRRAKTM